MFYDYTYRCIVKGAIHTATSERYFKTMLYFFQKPVSLSSLMLNVSSVFEATSLTKAGLLNNQQLSLATMDLRMFELILT